MSRAIHQPLLVAAFDFGTTYSGYAFSFRDDPMKVRTNQNWIAGSEKLISLKTPTCVLVDPDGNFAAFGFDAENRYTTLLEDDQERENTAGSKISDGWRLFRRFKMILHNNESPNKYTAIKDMRGVKMRAFPIFVMSIRYLRKHFLDAIERQSIGVEETDIQYVLTVPAIWKGGAKNFMEEAARKAGIDIRRLKCALEPEAASLWCERVNWETKLALAGQGTQYMVVDLGGGTADISVREVISGEKTKEIHNATGGPWGGIYVDENFLTTLEELFGQNTIEAFKTKNMADFFDILRDFETKKRTFSLSSNESIVIRVPMSLRDEFERETGESFSGLHMNDVKIRGKDKLRFSAVAVKRWFDGPVDAIIEHIKDILQKEKLKGVRAFLLVGGFGESMYVLQRFELEFPGIRRIVPDEAGLVVLKGAVRYGHSPSVSQKTMEYTFGVEVVKPFDNNIHPESVKITVGREKKAGKCFSVFFRAGDLVNIGQAKTCQYIPHSLTSALPIYRSTDKNPCFTTDPGCSRIAEIDVKCADHIPLYLQRTNVTFIFRGQDIQIKTWASGTREETYLTIPVEE